MARQTKEVTESLDAKFNEFQKTQMVIESSNLGKQLYIYDIVDLISRGWKSEKKNQNQFIAFFPIFKLQCNCVGDNVLGMDYAVSLAFLLQQKYHNYLVSVQKKRYLIHLMSKYNYLPGRYLLTFFQITRSELCTSLSEFAHHLFQSPVFIKNFFNEKLSANHNLEQLFGNRFCII